MQPLPPDLAHLAAAGRGHRTSGVGPDDAKRQEPWLGALDNSAGLVKATAPD